MTVWAKALDGNGEARLVNMDEIAIVVRREDGGQDLALVRDGRLSTLFGSAPGIDMVGALPGLMPGRIWNTRFEGGPIDRTMNGMVNIRSLLQVADRGKSRYLWFKGGFEAWTDIPMDAFEAAARES